MADAALAGFPSGSPGAGGEWPQRSCLGNDQQEKMPLTVKSARTRESLEAVYGKAAFRS
jgi:hypothetical protein